MAKCEGYGFLFRVICKGNFGNRFFLWLLTYQDRIDVISVIDSLA